MTRLHRRLLLALRRWDSRSEQYAQESRIHRRLWAILARVAPLLLAASLHALDLTQDDKQSHVVLGAASSACSMLLLDRIKPDASWQTRALVGIASAAVIGAAKELADSRDPQRHDCDRDDFYATTIGGAAVSLVFCWRIK